MRHGWLLRRAGFGLLLLAGASVGLADAQVGLNFTGTTSLNAPDVYFPPDTEGAVGPASIVELINGSYTVYSKSTGSLTMPRVSMDSFWNTALTNSGVAANVSGAFDPRVLYDAGSGRWFASAADRDSSPNSRFLVAVSNSSNPADGWKGYTIKADPASQYWADFPMLGFNSDGVFLSANMFGVSTANQAVSVVAIPKANLLSGSVGAGNYTIFSNLNANSTGFTVHPTIDPTSATGSSGSGTPFSVLSDYITDSGQLKLTTVNGPITSPSFNSNGTTVSVTPAAFPPDAPQKPSGTNAKLDINTGDDTRFGSSVIVKTGNIWATQPIDVNGRAAVRWYEIRPSDGAVLESGNISDPKLSLYYPSIAVNDAGTVVIGFTGSSPDTYASSYAIVGNPATDGSLTFGSLMLLKSGLSDYQQIDGNGENRWGDYSATLADPTDPNSFWTFQEFVAASDQWGIQITQIVTPEPSSVAMLLVSGGLLLRRRRRTTVEGI